MIHVEPGRVRVAVGQGTTVTVLHVLELAEAIGSFGAPLDAEVRGAPYGCLEVTWDAGNDSLGDPGDSPGDSQARA